MQTLQCLRAGGFIVNFCRFNLFFHSVYSLKKKIFPSEKGGYTDQELKSSNITTSALFTAISSFASTCVIGSQFK